jgi:hypothetical protein
VCCQRGLCPASPTHTQTPHVILSYPTGAHNYSTAPLKRCCGVGNMPHVRNYSIGSVSGSRVLFSTVPYCTVSSRPALPYRPRSIYFFLAGPPTRLVWTGTFGRAPEIRRAAWVCASARGGKRRLKQWHRTHTCNKHHGQVVAPCVEGAAEASRRWHG